MTSQIFANIYLNEFDRYVRHHLKPLAYVRYGDDFVLFMPDRQRADQARDSATQWLQDSLRLQVHTKNNVIVKAGRGLYFLGHVIYPSAPLALDQHMRRKISQEINSKNASSYSAMRLTVKQRKQLPWLLRANLISKK